MALLTNRKDPLKPKKARSAFTYFMSAIRSKVVEENDGASFGDIGRIVGEKWRTLPEDEKKKYEALAKNDLERYEKEAA
ncbi:high mobility group box domain-containing protein, partial [Paraphysoderma sedebokerense]